MGVAPPTVGRRSFVTATLAGAAACHVGRKGSSPPGSPDYLQELSRGLTGANHVRIRGRVGSKTIGEEERQLQRTLRALMMAGTRLDLSDEGRDKPELAGLLDSHAIELDATCGRALVDAELMLEDREDPTLKHLDTSPSAVLEVGQIIDEIARSRGAPDRFRRRLQKTSERIAFRIERQSARAVVGDAVDRSHRLMARWSRKSSNSTQSLTWDEPLSLGATNEHIHRELFGFAGTRQEPDGAHATGVPIDMVPVMPRSELHNYLGHEVALLEPRQRQRQRQSQSQRQRKPWEAVPAPPAVPTLPHEVSWAQAFNSGTSGVLVKTRPSVLLLDGPFRRVRIRPEEFTHFAVGPIDPLVLKRASRSANLMIGWGAALIGVGAVAGGFTLGMGLFPVTPGIVLLSVGLVRRGQLKLAREAVR